MRSLADQSSTCFEVVSWHNPASFLVRGKIKRTKTGMLRLRVSYGILLLVVVEEVVENVEDIHLP